MKLSLQVRRIRVLSSGVTARPEGAAGGPESDWPVMVNSMTGLNLELTRSSM